MHARQRPLGLALDVDDVRRGDDDMCQYPLRLSFDLHEPSRNHKLLDLQLQQQAHLHRHHAPVVEHWRPLHGADRRVQADRHRAVDDCDVRPMPLRHRLFLSENVRHEQQLRLPGAYASLYRLHHRQ